MMLALFAAKLCFQNKKAWQTSWQGEDKTKEWLIFQC
jgi:hypothetical protein